MRANGMGLWACVALVLLSWLLGCGKEKPGSAEVDRGQAGGQEAAQEAQGADLSLLPVALQKAIEQARREKKLVIVDVTDPDCPFCEQMDGELKNRSVRKALEEFVFVKMGTTGEAEERILDEFSLIKVPTFLFYKGDGTPLDDWLEGFRSAKVFIAELENMKILAAGGEEFVEVPEDDHPSYGLG